MAQKSVAVLLLLGLLTGCDGADNAWTPLNNVPVTASTAAQNTALMQQLVTTGQQLNQQADAVKTAIAAEKGSL